MHLLNLKAKTRPEARLAVFYKRYRHNIQVYFAMPVEVLLSVSLVAWVLHWAECPLTDLRQVGEKT